MKTKHWILLFAALFCLCAALTAVIFRPQAASAQAEIYLCLLYTSTAWDAEKEEWYFSVVDVVRVLTDSADPAAYWRKLKQRLKAEGNETVTNCHGLKMTAPDGKKRLTDVADTEQLLRICLLYTSRCV